eukprot:TRINITY_DN3136_c0_g1_i1.p1 TRINITY_DN3136_c0_g1~~TRINITY_DN3136_c0_g1_i1.p1  ORF type:complete len:454 (-),score=123.67 TRINITY_DN3136_c0_g1_i1:661-2022(-)
MRRRCLFLASRAAKERLLLARTSPAKALSSAAVSTEHQTYDALPPPAPSERTTPQAPSSATFAGGVELPLTSSLHIVKAESQPRWPVYRVIDTDGALVPGAVEPELSTELAMHMVTCMVRLRVMDHIFYNAQRQGRISFYMTSTGEEATQICSAAALSGGDTVFGQYREPGVLMWRGFSLQNFADQLFSNTDDLGRGRQMPVHYGSSKLNFQTISSPLATQIPQAVGAAYALKQQKLAQVVACYFGDGAASEGDFHAAMNFAATLECPVLFICRNNGYAISTPVEDQYRGDGIVSRAPGYGMAAIRVDGNDALAVFAATQEARRLALAENRPVLLELMTYRVGHHSTSDDWSRYRMTEEVKDWQSHNDPLRRLLAYLHAKGLCDADMEQAMRDTERLAVMAALEAAEKKGPPPLQSMFEDVYRDMPQHLLEQRAEMLAHVAKYPDKYPQGGGH